MISISLLSLSAPTPVPHDILDAKITEMSHQLKVLTAQKHHLRSTTKLQASPAPSADAACMSCTTTTYAASCNGDLSACATALAACVETCVGVESVLCGSAEMTDITPMCSLPSFQSVDEIEALCTMCPAGPQTEDGDPHTEEGIPFAAPSPPPATPVAAEVVNVMPGWCPDWNHRGFPAGTPAREIYFTQEGMTQADCNGYCDANPLCEQAIFEAEGPWGTECWLGTNTMPDSPNGRSRNCARGQERRGGPPCLDFCYSKAGWSTPA